MAGRTRLCLTALVAVFWGSAAFGILSGAESSLIAHFDSGVETVAFVLQGGREAISVGVAGTGLEGVKLGGAGAAGSAEAVADPVSRLILFRSNVPLPGGLALANQSPASGVLMVAGAGAKGRIQARVEQVGGKILPFTLLKIAYSAAVPAPGTPLLNPAGEVVAIGHEPAGGLSGYAVPVEVIRRFVDGVHLLGRAERSWLGLKLNPGSQLPKVTEVSKGSPAAQGGLQVGDLLVEVGGHPVGDYGDAVNAFYLLLPGKAAGVKVKRGESEVTLAVTPVVAKR